MREFTFSDLRRLIRECSGDTDSDTLDGDIQTIPFQDMGYDSLVMLETATKLNQEFGIMLPDDLVFELSTPQDFVDAVRQRQSAQT